MLATAWPKKPLGRSEHPSIDVEIWKRNREYDHFCVKPTEIVRFFNQNIYFKRREKIQKIHFPPGKNIPPKNSTFPPRKKKQQFTSRNLDSKSPSPWGAVTLVLCLHPRSCRWSWNSPKGNRSWKSILSQCQWCVFLKITYPYPPEKPKMTGWKIIISE